MQLLTIYDIVVLLVSYYKSEPQRRHFMKIYRAKDYNDMSRKAANLISAQILLKPNCVLGLATGSTPLGTYRQLVERYNQGDLDFSEITTVNLDEYKGLTHDNSQSYYYFMNENLFSKVNINKSKVFLPDGTRSEEHTSELQSP